MFLDGINVGSIPLGISSGKLYFSNFLFLLTKGEVLFKICGIFITSCVFKFNNLAIFKADLISILCFCP